MVKITLTDLLNINHLTIRKSIKVQLNRGVVVVVVVVVVMPLAVWHSWTMVVVRRVGYSLWVTLQTRPLL